MTRRLHSLVLLALLAGCDRSGSATTDAAAKANCRRDAQASVDAFARRDADAIVALMHPDAIRAAGQDAGQMKAMLTKAFADMTRDGVTLDSVAIDGPPDVFAGGGGRRFGIVGQTLNIRLAGRGRVQNQSFLLGISDDAGRSWRFIDGAGLGKVDVTTVVSDYPIATHPLPAATQPTVTRE